MAKSDKLSTIGNISLLVTGCTLLMGIILRLFARSLVSGLETHRESPASSYDEALAQFDRLQEKDTPLVNPVCGSRLLTHGHKTAHVVILMHGITNCPAQFVEFAPYLYEQGYNVLIPRMPRNGLADRMTDDLKYLSAQELIDASNSYADIAHGLGRHVTFMGLSAGGTMAAWVAQHRCDVHEVVLIAPMLGFARLGPRVTILLMKLFLKLPDIGTQHIFPFQDGPTHSYLGYSTHALVAVMRLAGSVFLSARTQQPACQSVILVTNASDTAVNNTITWQLIRRWSGQGLKHLEAYEFGRELRLIHDIVDPQQKEQQTAVVYPILWNLMTHHATIESRKKHVTEERV